MKGQNSFNIFCGQFFDPLPQLTTPILKHQNGALWQLSHLSNSNLRKSEAKV